MGYGRFADCEVVPNRFHFEVFNMLKAEGKIAEIVIEKLMSWLPARLGLEEHHSWLNVYCGNAVCPHSQVRPNRRKLGEWKFCAGGFKLV